MQLKEYKPCSDTSTNVVMASSMRTVQNNASILTSKKVFTPLNRSVFSHTDESSSDEDLREPTAESPPNLSDEECVELSRTHRNIVSSNNLREEADAFSFPSSRCHVQTAVTNIDDVSLSWSRDSSQASLEEKASPVAEAVKPRALPRRVNKPRICEQSLLERNELSTSQTEVDTPDDFPLRLPYLTRGSSASDAGRSFKLDNAEVKTNQENASTRINRRLSNNLHKAEVTETNLDISSKRISLFSQIAFSNSSGYSSPGSLSSSTSNASSTNSYRSNATSERSIGNYIAARRRTAVSTTDEELTTETAEPMSENPHGHISDSDEEDIFPIASLMEAEYKRLLKDTFPSETSARNRTESDNSNCVSSTSEISSRSSFVKSRDKSLKARPKHNNEAAADHRIETLSSINSICMVEDIQAQQRNRNVLVSGNVKKRLPGHSAHARKTDASRNSRAFALQAKKLNEDPAKSSTLRKSSLRKNLDDDAPMPSSTFPEDYVPEQLADCKREISASLARLDRSCSPEVLHNSLSDTTNPHLSEEESPFPGKKYDKTVAFSTNNNNCNDKSRSQVDTIFNPGSTWSLKRDNTKEASGVRTQRRPSIRNRIKEAFSFQNIRKAISMERLDEDERQKSVSHCYLNEYGKENSQVPQSKPRMSHYADGSSSGGRFYKAPSLSALFNTVRMRKKKSRDQRAIRERNTIAVDHDSISEFQTTKYRKTSVGKYMSEEVGTPAHFRPIGRVLEMDIRQGSLLIEMNKPPSGPFGFYLARSKENGSVYISNLSDSYPDKMFAGLMKLGDEITEINGTGVQKLSLEKIYEYILENNRLVLRIKPSQVHTV